MEHLDMQDITSFNLRISYRICSGVVTVVKEYNAPTVCNAIKQATREFPTFISIEALLDNRTENEVKAYEVD